MSSILKALQKLENDKASRQTREPDISRAIISEKQRRSTRTRWIFPTLVTVVAAVSVILTYTFMGGFSKDRNTSKLLSQQAIPSLPPIAPQTPSAKLPTAPKASTPDAQQNSERSANPALTEQRTKQSRPLTIPSAPVALPEAESSTPESVSRQTESSANSKDLSSDKLLSFPKFSINGIAWQKDSASRLAVINGVPVREGNVVEGAKIEQIFQDHVRLSLEGRSFDVLMEREGRQ